MAEPEPSSSGEYMTKAEHMAFGSHAVGRNFAFPQTQPTTCTPGYRRIGQSVTVSPSDHQHNIRLLAINAAVTDGLLTSVANMDPAELIDGLMVLDTQHDRLYIRTNGVWKYSALI